MSPKRVVFKKVSRDKSVAIYMANRDFVDHCDHVDPVDGVIVVDPSQLKGKRVYVMLTCTFRYGRRGDEVMGVAFRRDLFAVTRQVYPPLMDKERQTRGKIQEKLLSKLGPDAYPFFLELPDNLPNSVTLQPGPSDVGKKCAVEFQVKAFGAGAPQQQAAADKLSQVGLTIRKIQYGHGPARDAEMSPTAETTFEFLMSDGPLRLKLRLPKETFYHGEPVRADVSVDNSSNRTVKDVSLSAEQVTNVILYSDDKYVKTVAKEETGDGAAPGSSWIKSYTLYPRLEHNKERRGLALDGHLKHQDTNLASSSVVKPEVLKELQGMLVSYKLLLKMTAAGEVCVELPFKLMHPKPQAAKEESECDDITFQDFKRAYLRGVIGDDDEEEEDDA
ncbi:S-arrestin-like isoform X2 [Corythoichthys intestinalis]|uniref:S-arrestin-like isoform X2 n=1 Tax=Corythoichthys intestinalis TaxID=161448 RepID=UPI0025A67389|nr:S-arrestin-like isoform X2 [Corythoichthys intestinalis]